MNPFPDQHFQGEIILWAVPWYCINMALAIVNWEMLAERGVNVDHAPIYCGVQRYALEIERC